MLLVVPVVFAFAACSYSPPPGTGDPGNARLNTLAGDPIFQVLPPDSALTRPIQKVPAEWDSGYGLWNGPDVEVDMKSRGTLADVLSFYDAYAPAHGWSTAPGHKKLGYSSFWEKTLPDGVKAALSLFYGGSALSTPDQQAPSYELVGSVSAKL